MSCIYIKWISVFNYYLNYVFQELKGKIISVSTLEISLAVWEALCHTINFHLLM